MSKQMSCPTGLKSPWQFKVAMKLSQDGPVVMSETVTESDVSDHQSELWREGCLRKGHTDTSMQDLEFEYEPIFPRVKEKDKAACIGLSLAALMPWGDRVRRSFSMLSLELVASRAAGRLITAGELEVGSQYYYYLSAMRRQSKPVQADNPQVCSPAGFSVREERCPSVSYINIPISALLANSRPVNVKGNAWPVFYTTSAFGQAKTFCQKGVTQTPPVETGGVLIGMLGACPETAELFGVITHVVEPQEVQQSQFSLTLQGKTWQQLQKHLRILNSKPGGGSYQIVGECHGHPFRLSQPTAETAATSAFASLDDRLWHHAVFDRQPCQLCHIFGFNHQQHSVNTLFGLEDARLLERGYYLIEQPNLNALMERIDP